MHSFEEFKQINEKRKVLDRVTPDRQNIVIDSDGETVSISSDEGIVNIDMEYLQELIDELNNI